MTRRQGAALIAVFGAGAALGGAVVWRRDSQRDGDDAARLRAIRLLEQAPPSLAAPAGPFITAVRRIAPAVVNIDTVGAQHTAQDPQGIWPPASEVHGKGSGVILTSDGYIVTNDHVTAGAQRIRVTLMDGRSYFARYLGGDASNDLALLRIDGRLLPSAPLGNSDDLAVGQPVIAVGNPLGLGSTVTAGIVSALHRRNLRVDEGRVLDGAIQTDAAINRGSSGGALADSTGRLIGVTSAILSTGPSGGSIGLGFAIPVNKMREIVTEVLRGSRPPAHGAAAGWVGLDLVPLLPDSAASLGLRGYVGTQVDRLPVDSPARAAGVQSGDVLLTINGKPVHSVAEARTIVRALRAGTAASLGILRPGDHSQRTIAVIVEAAPPPSGGRV